MEAVGIFHDEKWESKMFSCEDSDFLDLNSNGSTFNIFSNAAQPASTFLADHESRSSLPSSNYNLDHTNSFYCEISQESSNSSEIEGTLFAENGDIHPYSNGTADFVDQSLPVFSDEVMQEILQLKAELWEMDNIINPGFINTQTTTPELNNIGSCNEMQQINLKRKCEKSEDINDSSDQSPKKKARASRNAQKSKRGPRKNKKNVQISNDEEEDNNGGGNEQSSSTCSFEDDDSNAKGKASRGSATDPQSLYARRRRERINERLRILQNLVPNGTKVDISTMLEEAVHYVKFLQLQIKLLSSDDMWMYAPIAYNGMDMGLYQKINNLPNLRLQN